MKYTKSVDTFGSADRENWSEIMISNEGKVHRDSMYARKFSKREVPGLLNQNVK